jgi:hypothetical protein
MQLLSFGLCRLKIIDGKAIKATIQSLLAAWSNMHLIVIAY